MKAVLLAAGLGTRLRPLTDRVPKCLVEVGGRALLDLWLDALDDVGVDQVVVNTHHLADQVDRHVAARATGPAVTLAHEPVLLGSAGTLRRNADLLAREEMFLVLNADNLTDFDLRALVEGHRRGGLPATLTVFETDTPHRCGIVEVHDGLVTGFEEKPARPRGNLANAGLYAFSPAVLELIDGSDPLDIGYDLLPRLVGAAGVVPLGDARLIDIGTPEALSRARLEWERELQS